MDISTDCCTYWAQCIFGVSLLSAVVWNIPKPVDQVLDGRVVQTHIKIDVLCEQRWPPEQQPGKKSGHMLHLLCHQGPLGTICMQQDSDHVCICPGYHLHHDTAKYGYSCVVKESTNGALLSSVMRVGSVCMRVMDVHVHDVDLVSVIFWSTFAHDTQASPQASWHGYHQLQLAVAFVVPAV